MTADHDGDGEAPGAVGNLLDFPRPTPAPMESIDLVRENVVYVYD